MISLLFNALLIISMAHPAEARLGASCGGGLVVLDLATGKVQKEIKEPNMLGPSFHKSPMTNSIKVTWEDCVWDKRGYRFTELNNLGIPKQKLPRELEFRLPTLST